MHPVPPRTASRARRAARAPDLQASRLQASCLPAFRRRTHLGAGSAAASLLVGLAALPGPLRAQDQDAARLKETFAALSLPQQLAVLSRAEARLRGSAAPPLQRIAAMAAQARDAQPLRPRTFHDPAVFAPVAPKRVVIDASDPSHAAVRASFPQVRVLRDLHPQIVYDWAYGAPARLAAVPTPAQRFSNLVAGYPPDADSAMAAVLCVLDRDGDQRQMARWCEQLYADRMGKVFAGVTLYEAWYAGSTVEVPDVDVIAFARQILHTDSFVSPIPGGPRRDRLYGEVREAFKKHREYRTLCEAAAATFVTDSPELDPVYQPLVDRMHLLWGECGHQVDRMAEQLTAQDRSELLRLLDDRIREDPAAGDVARASKDEMRAVAATVRAVCAEELAAAR